MYLQCCGRLLQSSATSPAGSARTQQHRLVIESASPIIDHPAHPHQGTRWTQGMLPFTWQLIVLYPRSCRAALYHGLHSQPLPILCRSGQARPGRPSAPRSSGRVLPNPSSPATSIDDGIDMSRPAADYSCQCLTWMLLPPADTATLRLPHHHVHGARAMARREHPERRPHPRKRLCHAP